MRKTKDASPSCEIDGEIEATVSRYALERWGQRLALVAVVLAATYATSVNVADPDLWGHVQYGQDVLSDGYLHKTTTYSFTAVGYRWINHENLAELIFAMVVDFLGPTGLLVLKFLLSVLVFGLIVHRCRRQGLHLLVIATTVLLVGNAISCYWSIRPQMFTFTCFALLVALLNWSFHSWNDHWNLRRCVKGELDELRRKHGVPKTCASARLEFLWLTPVLFLFWANAHGGFVAGLAVYLTYLGLRSIEALCQFGRGGFVFLRRFALVGVVATLATLMNPYGPELHHWLWGALGRPRPEIMEWGATNLLGENGWRFVLVILAAGLSLALSKKEKDFTQLVLLVLTLWQAIEHHRHVPFFCICFAFWVPTHLQSALRHVRLLSSPQEEGQRSGIPVFVGSLVCILILGTVLAARMTVIEVKKGEYPVAAFEYLRKNGISGKMVVNFRWAQYAIAAFKQTADVTGEGHISFDGRFRTCYPQQIADMHFDFFCGNGGPDTRFRGENSPPYDGSRVLSFRDPELVVISRRQEHAVCIMEQNAREWGLIYQDELTQVWGVKRVFDDPDNSRYIPPAKRKIADEIQSGYAAWPAIRENSPHLRSRRVVARTD